MEPKTIDEIMAFIRQTTEPEDYIIGDKEIKDVEITNWCNTFGNNIRYNVDIVLRIKYDAWGDTNVTIQFTFNKNGDFTVDYENGMHVNTRFVKWMTKQISDNFNLVYKE